MQKYPRGRRGSPAKGVGGYKPCEGSNPSFCATSKRRTFVRLLLMHMGVEPGALRDVPVARLNSRWPAP